SDLKKKVENQNVVEPVATTKKSPVAAKPSSVAKGDRFTGKVKCFDKECYNMMITIFDKKEDGFLSYFYRAVKLENHGADIMAKIPEPVVKALDKARKVVEGDFEKDGYHYVLELTSANFDFYTSYSISMVSGEFQMILGIKELSGAPSSLKAEASGSMSASEPKEYTVKIKKK
ncbi:MAG: hypothetical protein ABL927_15380, partial [Bdellovibrionales bacterium]